MEVGGGWGELVGAGRTAEPVGDRVGVLVGAVVVVCPWPRDLCDVGEECIGRRRFERAWARIRRWSRSVSRVCASGPKVTRRAEISGLSAAG